MRYIEIADREMEAKGHKTQGINHYKKKRWTKRYAQIIRSNMSESSHQSETSYAFCNE